MSTNLLTKRCSQCQETKPAEQFSKQKSGKGGLRANCRLCDSANRAAWRAANLEKHNAYNAAYYAANSEKVKANMVAWRAANLEKHKVSISAWQKANPDKVNAINAKRRAAKLQAMLKYGKEAHKKDIDVWYTRARLATQFTGEKYHVDHIVPLQGKTVSGLHVPWNLQLLTATENISKGNRHAD